MNVADAYKFQQEKKGIALLFADVVRIYRRDEAFDLVWHNGNKALAIDPKAEIEFAWFDPIAHLGYLVEQKTPGLTAKIVLWYNQTGKAKAPEGQHSADIYLCGVPDMEKFATWEEIQEWLK